MGVARTAPVKLLPGLGKYGRYETRLLKSNDWGMCHQHKYDQGGLGRNQVWIAESMASNRYVSSNALLCGWIDAFGKASEAK